MPDIPSLKSLSYSPLTQGFRSDIIEAQARKDQGYEAGNAITEYCLHVQLKLFPHPSERKGRFAQLGFVVAQSFMQMTEDTPGIANDAVLLNFVIRTIHPCDGLQHRCVAENATVAVLMSTTPIAVPFRMFWRKEGDSLRDRLNAIGNLQIPHCRAYRGC